MFESHLCKSNHPPKSLYGNVGTTRVICVLASPCRRHSTPSVNPKLPPTAFCFPGPRRSVSWLSPFSHFSIAKCLFPSSFLNSNVLAFPLSLFPYPGIQLRPSALVDNSLLYLHNSSYHSDTTVSIVFTFLPCLFS